MNNRFRATALLAIAVTTFVVFAQASGSARARSLQAKTGPHEAPPPQAPPADNQPLVCPFGASPCIGRCGRSCYQAAMGEHCMKGQVCPVGMSVCGCSCYEPAKGEHCSPN